ARAITAQGKAERQRALMQWTVAETQSRDAIEDCRQHGAPAKELFSATKLQVECQLALDRAVDGAAGIEQLLGRIPDDGPVRSEMFGELARVRHSQANLSAEREALSLAIEVQKKVDRQQPSIAQAKLLNQLAAVIDAIGDEQAAESTWQSAADIYQHELKEID